MCDSKIIHPVKMPMVQIHCHSSFSNLDGAGLTSKLVEKAVQYGHPALATTEHGSPAGLFQHYKACKKAGIKPILGLEFYICNDLQSRVANKGRELEDRDYHQSIYIKDKEGYKNFNYLTYVSFTDGYYYKPRIDFDLLFSKNKGLMATSSCISSKINNYLTTGKIKEAEELFLRFRNGFGDDFYGEIQFNELNDINKFGINQQSNNGFIIEMCKKYDVPLLIGGDVHYVEPEDNILQDALINSKRQAKEGEEGFQIHARHLYYHDVADYYDFNKKFGYNYDTKLLEECFENSIKFSDKVNFDFEVGKNHLPKIKTNGVDSKTFLENITWEGIEKRINSNREHDLEISNDIITEYERRIPFELKVIDDLGLNDYLLIVQDIIKWEKAQGIFVGPGRGCFLPGSMVTLSNGLKVRIEDIIIGDKVSNHFSNVGEVSNVFTYNIDEEIVELEFENGKKISCTKDHEIHTNNRGWVKADELTENDDITELRLKNIKLKNKKYFQYQGNVHDLEIRSEQNDHSYNVENIVVHNSAAGSLVAYAIGITDLCPVQHKLLFERFINPERRCVPEGYQILMRDGSAKKIEDIKIGDLVSTPEEIGTLVDIIERYTDNETMIIIETEEGNFELTSEHIVPVIRKGKEIEIPAGNILETDFLVFKSIFKKENIDADQKTTRTRIN